MERIYKLVGLALFAILLVGSSPAFSAELPTAKKQCKCKCEPSCTCTKEDHCGCYDGETQLVLADPYALANYDDLLAWVSEPGHRAVLVVGDKDPFIGSYQRHLRVDVGFKDLKAGQYLCYSYNGVPSYDKYTPSPLPAVAAVASGTPSGVTVSACEGGKCSAPSAVRRGFFGRR